MPLNVASRADSRTVKAALTKVALAVALATSSDLRAATINVNASCTIRDAILAANLNAPSGGCPAGAGADIINLPASTITFTDPDPGGIFGDSATPPIESQITLQGSEGSALLRSFQIGTPDFRLLTVEEFGVLTINQVDVLNGSATNGGGIFCNEGILTISNSTIEGNTSSNNGGGIYAYSCPLTIDSNSTFANNFANGGGAIRAYLASPVSITNSSFTGNQALQTNGGALSIQYIPSSTIANSIFTDNQADDSGGAVSVDSYSNISIVGGSMSGNTAGDGGGAIFLNYSQLSLENSRLTENGIAAGGVDGGGALYSNSSTLTTVDSTISSNSASSGGGFKFSNSNVTIVRSTISGNSSNAGAGISATDGSDLSIQNSTVSLNTAGFAIGGIGLSNSSLSLNHATIFQNSGGNYASGVYRGGTSSSVFLVNSIIAANGVSDCNTGADTIFQGNWFGDSSCSGDADGDPMLGPLLDNGGPTRTHALSANSGAIDIALTGFCQFPVGLVDQRGFRRRGACDSGAYEFGADDTNFFVIPLPDGNTVVVPL